MTNHLSSSYVSGMSKLSNMSSNGSRLIRSLFGGLDKLLWPINKKILIGRSGTNQ